MQGYHAALATPLPYQVGAAFALGSSLIGLDLFDQSRTLAILLPKLVASYALDALEERTTDTAPPPAVVAAWLENVSSAAPEPHPAVGLGADIRLSGPKLSGAALEYDGVALHLSAFQSPGLFPPHAAPGPVLPAAGVEKKDRVVYGATAPDRPGCPRQLPCHGLAGSCPSICFRVR